MEHRLFEQLYRLIIDLGKYHSRRGRWYSDAAIALVYLWSVLWDRPRDWACDRNNWGRHGRDCPWDDLPSPSTLCRRLRTISVLGLIERAQAWLRDQLPTRVFKWIDAKPLPVGGASKDPDAKCGRGAGGKAKGYKIHVIFDASGAPDSWTLTPMNTNEKLVAHDLLTDLRQALYVAADNQYDGNPVFDAAAAGGAQLVVNPRRAHQPKGLGHRKHSPNRLRGLELASNPLGCCGIQQSFGQSLLLTRNGIERRLGYWGNFAGGLSPLPNWVRRPRRVALWVAGKFIALLLREWLKLVRKIRT